MFVTFYSYKGGVGRTLAVANVAYLLATNKREPCRVLLWDFDLEAPGLPHLFRIQWGQKRQGFVDLVSRYLHQAKVPPLQEYIHQSEIENIDILPAGVIDRGYAARLEQINWRMIYQQARGYDFLENLKEAIQHIDPPYEYVLVDSRTGYSDVGGICLHQLPDVVVLMFRLNNQNLDGTKKVYSAIKRFSSKASRQVDVIPVLSPVWPFATIELNSQIKKAKRLFNNSELLKVSFETDLTYAEKLIVKEADRYEVKPRILVDYNNLARHIRRCNVKDPLTLYDLANRSLDARNYKDAITHLGKLLELRPDNQDYWDKLQDCFLKNPVESAPDVFFDKYISNNPKVPAAYLTRASVAFKKRIEGKPLNDLTTALQLDPQYAEAYYLRAMLQMSQKQHGAALRDLNKYIELSDAVIGYLNRGSCSMVLKDFSSAIRDFEAAIRREPINPFGHYYLGQAYFAKGEYPRAKREYELAKGQGGVEINLAHALAAIGQYSEAKSLVDKLSAKRTSYVPDILNRAEAYLAIGELPEVSKLLKISDSARRRWKDYDLLLDYIKYVSLVLEGKPDKRIADRIRSMAREGSVSDTWSFLELNVAIPSLCARFKIDVPSKRELLSLLKLLEKAAENPSKKRQVHSRSGKSKAPASKD